MIIGAGLKQTSPPQQTIPDSELLADFLHELNIARRCLTLYPPSHPQVEATSHKSLERLQKLLLSRDELTFGIAPEALFFEDHWLDKDQPTFRQFAAFFSELGVASIGFQKRTSARELIELCQLLQHDRQTIEELGGFEQLLLEQQVERISIVPIDYSAFREKNTPDHNTKAINSDLWEDFLSGLLEDIIDLGQSGLHVAPKTIADLLNRKLAPPGRADTTHNGAVRDFIEQLLRPGIPVQAGPGNDLAEFLEHLSPQLQTSFLNGALLTLEKHPEVAAQILPEFPAPLLDKVFDPRLQKQLQDSPRLIELVRQLATNLPENDSHSVTSKAADWDTEMIRARLDVLFSEEQHDRYLPGKYQAALGSIFSADLSSTLPEDVRKELKNNLENQPVELQCCTIIFELLEETEPLENEEAVQQNLLDLSHFFLDTGNFSALRDIYQTWAHYLNSGRSSIDILGERVLASHTQQSFIQEVIDGIDIWGEGKATAIRDYIAIVGEPYTEPVIAQLGLAQQFSRRRYWIEVLSAIGADANQLLIEALNDERWYLIRNLLTVLGKTLSPTALKAIQKMAGHPHPKVRQEVIRVLFAYNPATANRLLSKELASPNPEIRLNAIKIADLSRAPEIHNFLHQQLQAGIDDEQSLEYKRQVLKTLARIGSDESLTLLKKLLRQKSLFTPKRIKQLHSEIIQSIGNYPHAKAEKTLLELAAEGSRQHAKLAQQQLKHLRGEPS